MHSTKEKYTQTRTSACQAYDKHLAAFGRKKTTVALLESTREKLLSAAESQHTSIAEVIDELVEKHLPDAKTKAGN